MEGGGGGAGEGFVDKQRVAAATTQKKNDRGVVGWEGARENKECSLGQCVVCRRRKGKNPTANLKVSQRSRGECEKVQQRQSQRAGTTAWSGARDNGGRFCAERRPGEGAI